MFFVPAIFHVLLVVQATHLLSLIQIHQVVVVIPVAGLDVEEEIDFMDSFGRLL